MDGRLRLFVGSYDQNVYGLDALTGKEAWRFVTGSTVNASPTFAVIAGRPMVFIASDDRTFYALDARDGTAVWSFETYPWTLTVGDSRAGCPVVIEMDGAPTLIGTMWNSDQQPLRTVQRGEAFAFEAATGAVRWRTLVSASPLTTPAVAEIGRRILMYVGAEDGTLYALDARTGEEIWRFTSDHAIRAAPVVTRIEGMPAVLMTNLFGMLRCLSAEEGRPIWSYRTGHEVLSTPAVAGPTGHSILVGSGDRRLHAVRSGLGERRWTFETKKYVVSSPVVATAAGRPFAAFNSLDNHLYLVDLATGRELSRFASGDSLWAYETRGISLWASPTVARAQGVPLLIFPAHDGTIYAFSERRSTDGAADERGAPPAASARGLSFWMPPLAAAVLLAAGAGMVLFGRKEAQ